MASKTITVEGISKRRITLGSIFAIAVFCGPALGAFLDARHDAALTREAVEELSAQVETILSLVSEQDTRYRVLEAKLGLTQ